MPRSREILIDELDGRMAAALLEDGRVQNLYIDPPDSKPLPGAIYLAEITRIDTGIGAAFLNLGDGTEGFLSEQDLALPGDREYKIEELQTGAKIIVQVKAGEDEEDNKLPQMTMRVQYHNEDDAGKMDAMGPPQRLQPGLNAALRMLKDYTNDNVGAVEVFEKYAQDALVFCDTYAPKASVHKTDDHLFDVRDVLGDLDSLRELEVPLKSGGNILIEPTRAMTVIDVNSGSDSNSLNVNLEAADEIARQIRLRNLSGMILVDFLKMDGKGEDSKVENALKAACDLDRIQHDLHGFTKLGLYEITRAKT